ncbi:MAG TPA: iron-containing alcohol dehydrogenase [Thermoanaerobaculia bacterium]|nr:iron-containing alcohol dehydrogenase [Thermoanaerobaculia bacterium]
MTASRAGRFRFRAGGAETEVLVGEGAFEALGARLSRIAPGRWFVVSSRPVFRRHGAALLAAVRGGGLDPAPLLVPDGEAAKSWSVLGRLLSGLSDRGLRRDGGLVALGGGTVGDVAGLAAALALRGVPVVQVPTTLLAAADSALGGKTAVDLPAGKNLAGAFHMPRLVAVEPAVFATLPPRAFRSGLAEVVKSALLSRTFFRAMPRLGETRRPPPRRSGAPSP